MPMSAEYRTTSRWVVRLCIGGLFVVACSLAGFAIMTENRVAGEAERTERAAKLSALYADARYRVGQEESLERKYRLEPSREILELHAEAGIRLNADLGEVDRIDASASSQLFITRLSRQHADYVRASESMLRAVGNRDEDLVNHLDSEVVDPVFTKVQSAIETRSLKAGRVASHGSLRVRQDAASATSAMLLALVLGILMTAALTKVLMNTHRRADAASRAELERLARAAVIDTLTGLRNHRAFHEDLARFLHDVAASGTSLALIVIDVDDLKAVNDTRGHQAGDDHLTALADELTRLVPDGASVFRTGGDEFAVILPRERAWAALELTQRVQTALAEHAGPETLSVTAGIAEATLVCDVDNILREADLALLATKRYNQSAAIYTPELELEAVVAAGRSDLDAEHTSSLADALSRAVDAKDSYTRSHCQTVSQLCALLATELDLGQERIGRMRLAGLLHDVGKIGVPDAILNKPAKLTDAEYEVMKRHSVLGQEIVAAAGLPIHAGWIRHHHERYDGKGYPDGLAGDDIPFESRIILAADAYEAMTSDRPYRTAPGRDFAIAELRRHAGTQFDAVVVDALCRALEVPGDDPTVVPVAPRTRLAVPARAAV
jgi:diguanylate cyclase (GGDEF)-like protein